MKQDIKSMLPDELAEKLKELKAPRYHADQIFRRLMRGETEFGEMTDISKEMRAALDARYYITKPFLQDKLISQTDGTVKYLWRLSDGNCIETVLMSYKHGWSVCVSSQVGCRMGCVFCASTVGGRVRNLEPSEILDQALFTELEAGVKISNIVLMGIGEPLDNFDNVLRFLRLVTHPGGRNIGMRHITLSTCGIAEMIDKLGDYNLQLTLSVSLHAPDDDTRGKLMPINGVYGVERLLDSCEGYFRKTGRRVSFEYAVINGVNDSEYHARLLASRMKRVHGHVNIIALNEVEGKALKPPVPEKLQFFVNVLQSLGVNVTVRRTLGSDVAASCGQLRRRNAEAADE